jgi:hypothetical protein
MQWRDWHDVGGDVRGTAALAGWPTRYVTVAARGQNGNVLLSWRDEHGWFGTWQDLGFPGPDPVAVTRFGGAVWVFARGTDNHLYVGGGGTWQDLGGRIASGPVAAQWRLDGEAHIFARGTDDAIWTLRWDGARASGWTSIGGALTSAPAAVAWGPNRFDVFARGGTLHLEHCWWDGAAWSSWEDLGGLLVSPPCAASRDIERLDVLYADDANQLALRAYDGTQWLPARQLGPGPHGAPSAFSFGPHHLEVLHTDQAGLLRRLYAEGARPGDDPATAPAGGRQLSAPPASDARATTTIHCVARGGDGHLHHVAYEDGYWGEWTDLGGSVAGDPVAVAPSPGVLDVAVRQPDNSVALRRLAAEGWSPWFTPNWQTPDDLAGFSHESETRLVLRGFDGHFYEGAVQWDGSWRPFRDIGGRAFTRPHVVRVAADDLPWPHGGIPVTTAAVPAGIYLFSLDGSGMTGCLRLGAGDWAPFTPFGAGRVSRPIHVPGGDGFPVAPVGQALGLVSQAGWLGRTAAGQIQAHAAWWQEHVLPGLVSYTALDTMPWTTVGPPLTGDPIGLTFTAVDPLDPLPPTTYAFARLPGGTIVVAPLFRLAPAAAPDWTAFGSGDNGDVALLQLWERFDDADLLHVVLVDPAHHLAHRAGGFAAEQPRLRPMPSSGGPGRIVFVDPILSGRPVRQRPPRP